MTDTTYLVVRAQDGARVREGLTIDQAQSEAAILSAQARQQIGLTAPTCDEQGNVIDGPRPIYGSMYNGEIVQYEIVSNDGLVVG